jgi:membrane protein YdbS with pleckstrin-like domain
MLSEKDRQFMEHWEKVRDQENRVARKLLNGLPVAALFSMPVLLLVFAVYLYFPDWYMKISKSSEGTIITVILAVILSMLFFSYFRMHYKWEMNEQLYRELREKEKGPITATDPEHLQKIK